MLETAYVLPLVLAVTLFIVEVVAFSMNSFAANDVLTDMHSVILSEVSDVSNLASGDTLTSAPLYASCSSDQVVLQTGSNALLTAHVKGALELKGISFDVSQPLSASFTSHVVSGFDVYVVNFTGVANSIVLPEFFNVFLPINVDTVISIKDTCVS